MSQLQYSQVHWGIIGAGDVCEVKSGPAFQRIEDSKLMAVMRRTAEKAEDFARRHRIPKWYANANELINDPEINAIYIATPPDTHAFYVIKAAIAGKPVYVEKPMARTYKEALTMVDACEKANVPLFVAYYRRALPNILKVKEIIDSGLLGDIGYVDIKLLMPLQPEIVAGSTQHWRVDPNIAGGGYFYDLGSHQLDALDFILGPVEKAKGFSINQTKLYAADDLTTGVFKFKNGVLGSGVWAFNVSETAKEDSTTIMGSRGKVSFPFFGDNHVLLELNGKNPERFNFEVPKNIQLPLIQTVVDELLNRGDCPSTGLSGLRTNWVMEQICNKD